MPSPRFWKPWYSQKTWKCLTLDCAKQRSHGSWTNSAPYRTNSLECFRRSYVCGLHRGARKVSLLEIKSRWTSLFIDAKDLSPLNVEPRQNSCFGLRFWFSWGSCNRVETLKCSKERSMILETCVLSMVLFLSQNMLHLWFTSLTLKTR